MSTINTHKRVDSGLSYTEETPLPKKTTMDHIAAVLAKGMRPDHAYFHRLATLEPVLEHESAIDMTSQKDAAVVRKNEAEKPFGFRAISGLSPSSSTYSKTSAVTDGSRMSS